MHECTLFRERRLPQTFHAAAAGLQHPGVHVEAGLGHELVPHQVGVVGRGDEVVAERLRHVLGHHVVLWVEDVPRRAAHVAGETWVTHTQNLFYNVLQLKMKMNIPYWTSPGSPLPVSVNFRSFGA